MSLIATEQLVLELCSETGEKGGINNQTIWGCIFDGIRDLNIHGMPVWEQADGLETNSYNAICWPKACVKPLITYLIRDGKPFALDISDEVFDTIPQKQNTNVPSSVNQQIEDFYRIDGFEYAGYARFNVGLVEIYGFVGNYPAIGIVTHDRQRRQSFVKGCKILTSDTFGMIFKSDGLHKCPEYFPSEIKEALELFALGKYFRTRNPNLGAMNKEKYKEEFWRLQNFYGEQGLNSWISALRSNIKSSPKF